MPTENIRNPGKIPEDLGTFEALEFVLRGMIGTRPMDFFPDKDKRLYLVAFPNADAQRRALLAELLDDEEGKKLTPVPVGKDIISHLARPGSGNSAELADAVGQLERDDALRLVIFTPPWNSGDQRVKWIPVRMVETATDPDPDPDPDSAGNSDLTPEKMIRMIAERAPKYFELAMLASMQMGCHGCLEEKDGLMLCRGCRVAMYCSKECQKTAWARGHEVKCAAMKTLRERVEGVKEADGPV